MFRFGGNRLQKIVEQQIGRQMPQIKKVSRWMAECLSLTPMAPQISYPVLLLVVECIVNKDDFDAINQRSRVIDETLAVLIKFESLLGRRKVSDVLCNLTYGPAQTISLLAQDLDLEVAGPILRKCQNVREEDLALAVKTRSLRHVLAVLERDKLSNTTLNAVRSRIKQEKLRYGASSEYATVTKKTFNDRSTGQTSSDRRKKSNVISLIDYR